MLREVLSAAAATVLLAACTTHARHARVKVDRYDDSAFVTLVQKHAPAGRVDYPGWKSNPGDMEALQAFINQVSSASPENRPELFPTPEARVSYWCNAYNAWTLWHVLDLWPIQSVMDVKSGALSYARAGVGFFYGRQVVVGNRTTNLYDLESNVIRKLGDPRVHFAINCASNSCPTLRALHWTEQDLDAATREFVNNPHHVRVTAKGLQVNPILDWYRADFGDLATFLARYATGTALREQLAKVQAGQAQLEFFEYDWGVNAQ